MRLYLSKDLLEMVNKPDPLAFWIKYGDSMSKLVETALKYLSKPATSVPPGRVFSKAGQVRSERRNRLTPKNVDKMVFLKANRKFKK